MHGPASDGATMSAIEVTRQFGTVSAICAAIPGSKIVTSSGTSSSRWRTSSAIRSGNASLRVATQTTSGFAATPSRSEASSACSSQVTSAPAASSASHTSSARSPPPTSSTRRESATRGTLLRSAQQDFEPYAVQAISMSL